jgi:hypothetical protein
MATYFCNPSYLGGGYQEDHGSRRVLPKSFQDPISTNELDMVACTCNPTYVGVIGRRITIVRPYLKNN